MDYTTKNDGEVSAVFFLGFGTELDCDLSRENIMAKLQEMFGIADFLKLMKKIKGYFLCRSNLEIKKPIRFHGF